MTARELARVVLAQAGALVTAAPSPSEAMQRQAQEAFDVLVRDVGMPDEDGHSFVRRLRASGSHRTLPAIELTGYARHEDAVAARAAGFSAHVGKPVDPVDLVAVVARWLRAPASEP